MLRATKIFTIAATAAILSSCAMDTPRPENDQRTEPASSQAEVQAATSSGGADEPANSASPADNAINPRAGCSIVQFCDAPGSDGTRCLQQGCSFDAARTECINEGWNVCGTPKCPWALVDTHGVRHELCT